MKRLLCAAAARYFTLVWKNGSAGLLTLFLVWGNLATAGSLIATWSANTEPDLAGYLVLYGTESGKYTTEVDVKDTTRYVATDLIDGQEYFFVIKAYDFSGNKSEPSDEVSATVGGAMLVAFKEDDTIRLIWTPVSDADSYQIFRGDNPYFSPTSAVATISASKNEFVDPFHFQSEKFETYYIVRAVKNGASIFDYNTVGAFDLNLSSGLNLVSLPLVPADLSIGEILADQLTGGESSAEADQLRLWNGEEYEIAWLYDGPAAEYKDKWIDASTGQETREAIDPTSAFWLAVQDNHPAESLTITGAVPAEPETEIPLKKGHNFIGSVYPMRVQLKDSELYEDGVMKGGVGSGEADIINAWTGDGYERAWVVDGVNSDIDGTWMDETGKNESTMMFQPGDGYIIWIKGDNDNKVWTWPNPSLPD